MSLSETSARFVAVKTNNRDTSFGIKMHRSVCRLPVLVRLNKDCTHLRFDLTHEKREKGWRSEGDRCPSHVTDWYRVCLNRSEHNGYLCRFLTWFSPGHEHSNGHDGQQPRQQMIRCWGYVLWIMLSTSGSISRATQTRD